MAVMLVAGRIELGSNPFEFAALCEPVETRCSVEAFDDTTSSASDSLELRTAEGSGGLSMYAQTP